MYVGDNGKTAPIEPANTHLHDALLVRGRNGELERHRDCVEYFQTGHCARARQNHCKCSVGRTAPVVERAGPHLRTRWHMKQAKHKLAIQLEPPVFLKRFRVQHHNGLVRTQPHTRRDRRAAKERLHTMCA